jgi:hypothetical protein
MVTSSLFPFVFFGVCNMWLVLFPIPKGFDYLKYSNSFHTKWIIQQKHYYLFIYLFLWGPFAKRFWLLQIFKPISYWMDHTTKLFVCLSFFFFGCASVWVTLKQKAKTPGVFFKKILNWDLMHQTPNWMRVFTLETSWMCIFTFEITLAFYKAKLLFQSVRGNQFCSFRGQFRGTLWWQNFECSPLHGTQFMLNMIRL